MEDKKEELYSRILDDKLTWETLVIDIIREENIDPWDIDVSRLTNAYISRIKSLQELNFRMSGKVLLIAAILLRMKSRQFAFKEEEETEESERKSLLEEVAYEFQDLEPRIPLPKTRKVTLDELMSALDSALEVKKRKENRWESRKILEERKKFEIEFKEMKISDRLISLFDTLRKLFHHLGSYSIKFSKLIPSKKRADIIHTFIPLIHLFNKGKVKLSQEECFGEITVELVDDSDLILNPEEEQ